MASISAQVHVVDNRRDKERLPRGLTGVRRTLDDVNLQVFNSEAIFTARMTERMENLAAGQSAQTVSFVSHMWTQRNGIWQLHDVRIVSASTLARSRPLDDSHRISAAGRGVQLGSLETRPGGRTIEVGRLRPDFRIHDRRARQDMVVAECVSSSCIRSSLRVSLARSNSLSRMIDPARMVEPRVDRPPNPIVAS